MKVVAAPNALKGSLDAIAAAAAIARGVRSADANIEVRQCPVADGGDGTRAILARALGGRARAVDARDPLGRARPSGYEWVEASDLALLDVASASGLSLLREGERDPSKTSSFGTGELLRAAIDGGARRLLLGVGGSATVDGGLGLLSALGARCVNADGAPIAPGGRGLLELAQLDLRSARELMHGRSLTVLCDVEQPLTGANGAARVFAPQKGADAAAVVELERGLERLADVLQRETSHDVRLLARGGAAGGIAATLFAVFGAELAPGIDFVLDALGFEQELVDAELVITAEGRLDQQSLSNKGPCGVVRRAAAAGVPTLALAGAISDDFPLESSGFVAALAIARDVTLEPLAHAERWLESTSAHATRLYLCGRAAQRARNS